MADQEPVFRIVRGTPTAEELAALVGVILTRSRPVADTPQATASTWVRTARPGAVSAAGLPARSGPQGWRESALPR
ncbi:MAG TPA: acyl-CoA carboxylase subunit epsilon [Micromonospora sp.]